MRNPITYITRILLAIERLRRRKKRGKAKACTLQDLFFVP
jgi:hypothetical protein